jgi:superfamily II DNA or RNA helicase/HKD family nuclease
MTLNRGLYDSLVTEALARDLAQLSPDVADVDSLPPDESVARIVEFLGDELRRLLDGIEGENADKIAARIGVVNELLRHVRTLPQLPDERSDALVAPPTVLRGIRNAADLRAEPPSTGLALPWLFTAGRGSPSLLTELRREAAACNQIDILVSFITVSGVRKLSDILNAATAADASGAARTKIRVLTTTYTGATEIQALDTLAKLNGCEVKISLDGRRSRLHAKAWIFHRQTGFGSAYVGSANLSGAALLGGLEWTVKFTERGQAALFDRAKAHFDTLWLDNEFSAYRPEDGAQRRVVIETLRRESGIDTSSPAAFFDIQPKAYQRDMLEQLAHERAHGRNRNLLVAATGTGKTIVAALDYRALTQQRGDKPRLLFVAHRAQILRQALRTYREVLRDHSFGELLTGGLEPAHHEHLFASIDSLDRKHLVETLGPSFWHTVVVDECHRLAADRFDRLATTIQPAQLLGLTATPERTDGRSIEQYFSPRPDRSPAVELRLWDALDMQLLAPFEYYACDDTTDFSSVPWSRAGEVAAIDRLVTGNDVRARMVVDEWTRLSGNPRRGKAIVFCVSIAHARFMTDKLNAAGIPALCVVGDTPKREQLRAPQRLARGDVCALVTVDLYNEGVDLPNVDTLVLLRPTQSPVLFQQQIGRGLRPSPGKTSCLVLDFVGQHCADFRFDQLLSGLTGLTRRQLIDSVEHGFSTLPAGCHIQLQPQTRDQVLRALRALTQQGWRRLAAEVKSYAAMRDVESVRLGEFLRDQHVQLGEVYRESSPSGWTSLKRAANLLTGDGSEEETRLSRRFGDLLHLDDPEQLALMRRVAESKAEYRPNDANDVVRSQMLAYQVDSGRQALAPDTFFRRLAEFPRCAEELGELADLLAAKSRIEARPVPDLEDVPLQLHGAYRIREILAAVGYHTATRRTPFQAGVLGLKDRRIELLFVTLDKSEGFHDRIAYHDYAVSPERFHWQTQNSAGPKTAAGKRYLESPANGWTFQLFVRVRKDDPYRVCGPVRALSPEDLSGNQPMNITWTLGTPLPPRLFADFSVLRGQG